MIQLIKKLFSGSAPTDFKQLMQNGATILDVRTPEEFRGGHIKGAINIPLQQLNDKNLAAIKKDKPVITCCASGMRSAAAKNTLKSKGYTTVHNGGGWHALQNKLN